MNRYSDKVIGSVHRIKWKWPLTDSTVGSIFALFRFGSVVVEVVDPPTVEDAGVELTLLVLPPSPVVLPLLPPPGPVTKATIQAIEYLLHNTSLYSVRYKIKNGFKQKNEFVENGNSKKFYMHHRPTISTLYFIIMVKRYSNSSAFAWINKCWRLCLPNVINFKVIVKSKWN